MYECKKFIEADILDLKITLTFDDWIKKNIEIQKQQEWIKYVVEGAEKACADLGLKLEINVPKVNPFL